MQPNCCTFHLICRHKTCRVYPSVRYFRRNFLYPIYTRLMGEHIYTPIYTLKFLLLLSLSHWISRVRVLPGFFFVRKMAMNGRKTIDLEQGWAIIMEKGITKLKNILEGLPEPQFSSEEYMMLYTTIYTMCTQKSPHDYSQQLYDKYKECFEEYISSTVLPSLRENHDEFMLQELVTRWTNHKIMVTWLSRFFRYLELHFIELKSLPTLNEVGVTCFLDLVYKEINIKVRDAVISSIDKAREGEQLDHALLRNVLDIGIHYMECYATDFETEMLRDTAAYYSGKVSKWILDYSCPDYMLKAEECLKWEEENVSRYFRSNSKAKLLETVQNKLLLGYTNPTSLKEALWMSRLSLDDKVFQRD